MIGLHIIADLYDIADERLSSIDENTMKSLITHAISSSDLSELGGYYHTFGGANEITGVIALAESHVTFHIWPEKKYISLDIFVCNLGEDNSEKAKKVYEYIYDFFKPESFDLQYISRNDTKKEFT